MNTGIRRQTSGERSLTLPPQMVIGFALVAIAWPIAWAGSPPWSEHSFFPLWLGYVLTVDGVTRWRTGASLLTRSPRRFVFLFLVSMPMWWIFEFANRLLDNWRYVTPRDYSPLGYVARASLAFSTVVPALFVTAELVRGLPPFRRPIRWWSLDPSPRQLLAIAASGLGMFVLSLVAADWAFPLVWIGLFLLLDPINRLIGARSLSAQTATGRWDTTLVLFAAGLICGFFWEMWNIRSMPKWVYDVPYAGWLNLFEMPALGYGGYLPFALEVYAFYHLVHRLVLGRPDTDLGFDRVDE